MTDYTRADAKHATIVRKALDDAVTSGVARPRLMFGAIMARLQGDGRWSVRGDGPHHNLTTDQAVATVNAIAHGVES